MRTLVILVYHGLGHFNAIFRLARILRRNNRVIFAGHSFFSTHVIDQGFEFYVLHTLPFGLGFENWLNKIQKRKPVYFYSLLDRLTNKLFLHRTNELRKLINDLAPSAVLIDAMQTTDFISLYPHLKNTSIKIGVLNTMLSLAVSDHYPPLNSDALPEEVNLIRQDVRRMRLQRIFKRIRQEFLYLTRSDTTLVYRNWKMFVGDRYPINTAMIFGIGIDDLPELILAPKQFDFPTANISPAQCYGGFLPDRERNEKFTQAFEKIDNAIQIANTPLIYCSFGTVQRKSYATIRAFLERLIAVTQKKNFLLLIAINDNAVADLHLPEGVFVCDWVPQQYVLQRTQVFITHGGINSIKEAVYAGVPMLAYPVDKFFDQHGNAARIACHKIGLRGNLAKDTLDDVQQKIELLLTDPKFKENISRLRSADEGYDERVVEDFLKNLKVVD